MSSPRVTVLIVTYNRAEFLKEAIQSVLDQTYLGWELLIADDGSTDETGKVVQEFAARDARIRYIKSSHFGRIAKISNFGFRYAQGEYVAILDDDDEWLDPNKLKKQLEFLDKNPDYVACGGGFVLVNIKGEEIGRLFKPEKDEAIRLNAIFANPMINSTTLFRRSVAEKIGLYDESLPQFADWDFWLKMGLEGKLCNFQEYFLKYRMWEKGMSFSKQKECAKATRIIVPRYRRKYPNAFKGFLFMISYSVYAYIPNFIKKFTNPILSKLKKTIAAR